MRFFYSIKLLFTLFLAAGYFHGQTQTISIELGPDEIGENQAWTISLVVQNGKLKNYDNFPDIKGLQKRGTSTQSTTNIINGQISSSQSVVMTYLPTGQGTFTLPAFSMKVNGETVQSPGKTIKVGAPVQVQQRDPFRSFFDRNDDFFGARETEFIDIKEDAFLAITTSKDEVYVGEGFNTSLAFYVAEDNRAPLQFYELGKQLAEILKKLRPTNCWEENFNIENIEAERVRINNKDYSRYRIYQGTFYPLNTETIAFPSVGLKMIKYKVAKNPSFFGQNRQEDFKEFFTKAKTIKVKDLPPHPLKDAVAVGDYHLEERMRNTDLETGKSESYEFSIFGVGNISSIEKPAIPKDRNFEFYEPNVRQNISRDKNRVTGSKSFSYYLIPREPGQFKLGDYFQWIYFNPNKEKYDTLKSKLTVYVTGESKKNESIQATDLGNFYQKIDGTDNSLHTIKDVSWQKMFFNAFLLVMIGASVYLVVKKTS